MRFKWLLLILALVPAMLLAEYTPKELFTIPWGDGPEQFKISHPCHNIDPIDSTDYIEPGRGPNNTFVDIDGNIIFTSYQQQVKGFDSTGNLIFNLSPDVKPELRKVFGGEFTEIFIDSNFQVYSLSEYSTYVTVLNYNGEILRKLYPFPDTIKDTISLFRWSPGQQLFFKKRYAGWVEYYDGVFTKTGNAGMLALNGYFYDAYCHNEDRPHTLYLGKYLDIDSTGEPGNSQIEALEQDMGLCDTLYAADIIPGGDGKTIYILAIMDSCDTGYNMIWEYDLDFNRLDQLRFPPDEGPDLISPSPFIGPDGSIYEFRALDNGLHVIKWTKK
jgi:hypothetical protein